MNTRTKIGLLRIVISTESNWFRELFLKSRPNDKVQGNEFVSIGFDKCEKLTENDCKIIDAAVKDSMKIKIEKGPFETELEALKERNLTLDNYHPYAYDTVVAVMKRADGYWVVGSRNKTAD